MVKKSQNPTGFKQKGAKTNLSDLHVANIVILAAVVDVVVVVVVVIIAVVENAKLELSIFSQTSI